MSSEFDFISLLVQSGGIGISLVLIWLIRYLFKSFKETIDNHLHSSNEAMREVARTNRQIAEKLQFLGDLANSAVKVMNVEHQQIIKDVKKLNRNSKKGGRR